MRNGVNNRKGGGKAQTMNRVRSAAQIFEKHGDDIHTIIRFNVKDNALADDVFQEFFLSIMNNSIPASIKDIKGYLYRAVTNDIIDVARRTKNARERIQRYAECRRYSIIQDDPENIVIQAEETEQMFRVIERQLPRCEAQAIIQRFRHDRDISQTAKAMKVKKRTISRYLCVALKKIRQLLREKEGEDNGFL